MIGRLAMIAGVALAMSSPLQAAELPKIPKPAPMSKWASAPAGQDLMRDLMKKPENKGQETAWICQTHAGWSCYIPFSHGIGTPCWCNIGGVPYNGYVIG